MEDKLLHAESSPSGLGRAQFLSLLGKTALGAWLLQLLPVQALPLSFPKRSGALTHNTYAARVAIHPMAVKRNK